MKRDMDLVRDLLLEIAGADEPPRLSDLVPGRKEGTSEYKLAAYHIQMLIEEAGLVRGIDAGSSSGAEWLTLELTWHGHDYLESIRDPTVWAMTKEGAQKLGGASWDVLIGLAKAYVKAEAKKRLGIDLG
jgi:hypothetical protein